MEEPLVVVKSLAYNQERFLRQMLEGIVSQKTNFRFVAVVHDDCSTDGSRKIIEEYASRYPDIIIPMFEEENLWSKQGGGLGAKVNERVERTGARYICFCEGDDYWDAPDKLQMQVDFLESHPDFTMVYSKVRRFDDDKKEFRDIWGGPYTQVEDLLAVNTVPTPGIMVRMSVWKDFLREVSPDSRNWLMGDYPMWLYMAIRGKVHFIDEPLAVYRIQSESACHSKSLRKTLNFRKNFFEISDFISDKFNIRLDKEHSDRRLTEKYESLLVPAFLLRDKDIVEEARSFYTDHPMGMKQKLVLNYPFFGRMLLKWKYRRMGYDIS